MYPRSKASRALIVLAVLAISVAAAWQLQHLRFDTSLEVWFVEDDPDLQAYHEFLDIFESDQIVIVAWDEPELWTQEGMAHLRKVTDAIESMDRVKDARSLANSSEVIAEPGLLSVRPLWDPDEPQDLQALKTRILDDEMFVGSLVDPEGKYATVLVTIEHDLSDSHYKIVMAGEFRELAKRIEAERGHPVKLAGPPILDDAFFRYTSSDVAKIVPGMMFAIILVILVLFRTPRALALPLSVAALSVLWTSGLTAVLGIQVTVVHNIVHPLILGLAIASSIHVTSRTLIHRALDKDPHEAAMRGLKDLWAPCFYTTLTTVGGLLSLWVGDLKPVREFGALSASGAVFALTLTYLLGPVLLPLLPKPKEKAPDVADDALSTQEWQANRLEQRGENALDRVLLQITLLSERHAKKVVAGAVLVIGLALSGLPHLKMGANVLEYFHKNDPMRLDAEWVDQHLGGTTTLEVFIDTGATDGLKDPDVLRAMDAIGEYMEGIGGVGNTISLADFVSELRQVQRGGADEERRVPDTRAEVSQLLLMLDDPTELERMADFDFARGRVTATVQLSRVTELTHHIPELEERLDALFGPLGVEASATGQSRLIHNMEGYLLSTMVNSLGLAFLLVSVLMAFALRSVKLGAFSMIPNVTPIAVALGTMAWAGMRLDPATATTGAVALGLVVDDTLHYLHQFREWAARGVPIEEATERTIRVTGRALVMTTVILAAAFLSMLVASFTPNNNFGMLCAYTICLALVADLIVLPAAIALIRPKFG